MPRRIYTYHAGLGWDGYNLAASIGSSVLALGILVVLVNFLLYGLRRGAPAGPDPWGGDSLEWATSSPPPAYNFVEIPKVQGTEPLWDQPELRDIGFRARDVEMTLAEGHDTMGTTVVDAEPESVLTMPEATYTPIVTAFGISVVFVGFLTLLLPIIVLGGVIAIGGMMAWLRPKELPE